MDTQIIEGVWAVQRPELDKRWGVMMELFAFMLSCCYIIAKSVTCLFPSSRLANVCPRTSCMRFAPILIERSKPYSPTSWYKSGLTLAATS